MQSRQQGQALQLRLQKQRELDALRTSLRRYKFGDKLGPATFDALLVSDMTQLRIGMFGPTGSGKSCFINTCERAVRHTDRGSVPESSAGGEGTIVLEDYLPEMFFKLVDTRGFFNYNDDESREFRDILAGRIRSGDVIRRGRRYRTSGKDVPFVDALHGVIFVLKANDIRLKNGILQQHLNPMREIIKQSGITSITVVTHGDKVSPSAAKNTLYQAFGATGSPNLFLFTNSYCLGDSTRCVDTEIAVFKILETALLEAESFVKKFKQERKKRAELALELARIRLMPSNTAVGKIEIGVFLSILRSNDISHSDTYNKVLKKLREYEINNLQALAQCWEDVTESVFQEFQYARRIIERELRQIRLIT